jgi:dihydropteroate synthase
MTDIVGILNITPDSFSDGGKFFSRSESIKQAHNLINSGATILDIGAESTRPRLAYEKSISPEEEWDRLKESLPEIISLAKKQNIKISIDTRNAKTVRKIIAENLQIGWINDVSAGEDIELIKLVAQTRFEYVIMHNLGIPANPNLKVPENKNICSFVHDYLAEKIAICKRNGIPRDRIIIDPGIGFGKTADQSLQLIKEIASFKSLGCRILVGHSRKSFFNLFTNKEFSQRDIETFVTSVFLANNKVDYLRVHDVEGNIRALNIAKGLF